MEGTQEYLITIDNGKYLVTTELDSADASYEIDTKSESGLGRVLVDKEGVVSGIWRPSGEFITGISARTDIPIDTLVLFLAAPLAGFLLPWGAIRTLSWILTGFAERHHLEAEPGLRPRVVNPDQDSQETQV
jgi:hypothetical protein